MYKGNYNFFDYKYNIAGYNGQDFGGLAQYLYLIISFVLIVILLFLLRKSSRDTIHKIIKFTSIFLIVFYIGKTSWESFYDIKRSGFNYYILPFDSCSIVMWASLIAGFSKSDKLKKFAECWLTTGGVVGGIAAMIFLNAFKFYPFLSFGAFYSMIWHLLMVFLGLLLLITKYVNMEYKNILNGFVFHIIVSMLVIPIDFIFNFDFMMYKNLGGIPIFEDIASNLSSMGLQFINPLLMTILYFLSFNLIFVIYNFVNIVITCLKKQQVFSRRDL